MVGSLPSGLLAMIGEVIAGSRAGCSRLQPVTCRRPLGQQGEAWGEERGAARADGAAAEGAVCGAWAQDGHEGSACGAAARRTVTSLRRTGRGRRCATHGGSTQLRARWRHAQRLEAGTCFRRVWARGRGSPSHWLQRMLRQVDGSMRLPLSGCGPRRTRVAYVANARCGCSPDAERRHESARSYRIPMARATTRPRWGASASHLWLRLWMFGPGRGTMPVAGADVTGGPLALRALALLLRQPSHVWPRRPQICAWA
jgi:hypothetical protein